MVPEAISLHLEVFFTADKYCFYTSQERKRKEKWHPHLGPKQVMRVCGKCNNVGIQSWGKKKKRKGKE